MNKLLQMSKKSLKTYIGCARYGPEKLSNGIEIDKFLDEASIFDDFESDMMRNSPYL